MRNYHLQNLPERIEKLRRHVKSRRGRRDFVALGTLVDIADTLKGRKPTTMRSMDAMLRAYYDAESAFLESWTKKASQPFFAMLQKDENCPPDRAYLVPVSFLPEEIVRAICPDCEQLITVSPNGKDPQKTNKRQRLDMHRKLDAQELCPGSGKDV
jgi:hypothetical protein